MKILAESLFEYYKFIEKSDPVKDMNIGTEKLINDWISKYKILDKQDYIIDPNDNVINTYNTVLLSNLGLEEFPEYIKFNHVMGGFHCDHNELTSLKGSPDIISGSFICSWNNLTNLLNGPKSVEGNYIASHNYLTSLEGLDTIITESLSVSNNNLKDLKGIPKIINGDLYIHNNPINTLKYFPDEIKGSLYYTESNVLKEFCIRERCKIKGHLINKQ